jgi:dihydrofolate reductase
MFSIIVASAKNGTIGNKGEIPWYLPDDFKYFAKITKGHTVVMGRKTYESIIKRIGKPLPERKNVVITNQENFSAPDCIVLKSIEDTVNYFKNTSEEIFIIGGSTIYNQFLPFTDKLYITEVNTEIDGDTKFIYDKNDWNLISKENHPKDDKHEYSFDFLQLLKNKN